MAISLCSCTEKTSEESNVGQVVLLNISALSGGVDLWISEDNKIICRFIERGQDGEYGLHENCYASILTKKQVKALNKVIKEHDFFNIKIASNHKAVPDEGRIAIYVNTGEKTYAVGKWSNEKHKDFDPIYEVLLKITESSKKGSVLKITNNKYWDWEPDGFPEVNTIESMTEPTVESGATVK